MAPLPELATLWPMNLNSDHLTDRVLGLGMSAPEGRFRLIKRILARLLRPFLGHQVDINRSTANDLQSLGTTLGGLCQRVTDLETRAGRLDALLELVQHQAFTRLHESIGPIHAQINSLGERLDDLSSLLSEEQHQSRARMDSELAKAYNAVSQEIEQLKAQIFSQMHDEVERAFNLYTETSRTFGSILPRLVQLDLFLDQVRRDLPDAPSPSRLADLPSPLEALYPALEEAFRGSIDEVRQRLIPYLEDIKATPPVGPVLDIGCGRGELLSLLAEEGIDAYGVDHLRANVEHCRAQGLAIEAVDAFEHLSGLSPASLRAVTAIHLIEHLDFPDQVALIDYAYRALAPEGILILETPNPENLVVASWTFYLDPTHRKPLPPQLLEFLVGVRGFSKIEVRRLIRKRSPVEFPWNYGASSPSPDVALVADALQRHLSAPPDYAILARKLT
jgi:2-polyprenyl-3-methyl-5-hydroxy-6-metoxy-1,4-benzoquinol methylase